MPSSPPFSSISLTRLGRVMGHPQVFELLRRNAQTDLDKVSEVVLAHLVDKDDAELRLSDLARRLGVELSSVSRKVTKLEEAGLVTKVVDPADARAWRLHLTSEGRDHLERLAGARQALVENVLYSWPDSERNEFARLLDRFATDFERYLDNEPDTQTQTGDL